MEFAGLLSIGSKDDMHLLIDVKYLPGSLNARRTKYDKSDIVSAF